MDLTLEQQQELAQFPAPLRALVEAELAAGNRIAEIGHSHPAPPSGAYVKLSKKISTRPRASGEGLNFYERNSSVYCGEFTDARRFYFVLEPPNPPPPEPDMEVIRARNQAAPDALAQLAQRPAGSLLLTVLDRGAARSRTEARNSRTGGPKTETPRDRLLTITETPAGLRHILHFRDSRPPCLVQEALERELMTLFTPELEQGKLRLRARANVIGALYEFELHFIAALPQDNAYSLCTEVSWAHQPASHHHYFRNTSAQWLRLWTRGLTVASPPATNEGSMERYQELCAATLRAQEHPGSVEAVQRRIIEGLRRGGSFRTSHKEGGTNIYWRDGEFIRSDYGDEPDLREFANEADFLMMLREFLHCDVTRNNAGRELSELDLWKLVLRRLNPDIPAGSGESMV